MHYLKYPPFLQEHCTSLVFSQRNGDVYQVTEQKHSTLDSIPSSQLRRHEAAHIKHVIDKFHFKSIFMP